jgi:hypothetical protein
MIPAIKRFSWFIAVLLLALAFPIQVQFDNPNFALLAYAPVSLVYILALRRAGSAPHLTRMDAAVGIYIFIMVGHLIPALLMHEISMHEGCRQILLFIMPTTFYFYVSRAASEDELRAIFMGIILAALIVGTYFAYDSYNKMILLRVSDYQLKVQKYILARTNSTTDNTFFRVHTQYRSMGLLETHAASGAWIGLGAFASFFFLSTRSSSLMAIAGFVWFSFLLAGLNFTSILGFLITIFCVYVWRNRNASNLLRVRKSSLKIAAGLFTLAAIAAIVLISVSNDFAEKISHYTALQYSLIFNPSIDASKPNSSWLSLLLVNITTCLDVFTRQPLSLLWGEGPIPVNFGRGGDTGFVETLAILGLPLFAIVVFGILSMTRTALNDLRSASRNQAPNARHGFLEFGISAILYIAIFDLHYSVWVYKSICPILFLALGLIRRYGRSAKEISKGGEYGLQE